MKAVDIGRSSFHCFPFPIPTLLKVEGGEFRYPGIRVHNQAISPKLVITMPIINDPTVVAEVTDLYLLYEEALCNNNLEMTAILILKKIEY